jgi:aspartate racemase
MSIRHANSIVRRTNLAGKRFGMPKRHGSMPVWQSTQVGGLANIPAMTSLQTVCAQPVGILGGMGPAAGAAFAERFVQACTDWLRRHGVAVNDQAFPEHWLVQASVPDRTAWLVREPDAPSPLGAMQHALHRLASVGVKAAAVACNTAHAWHAELQALVPQVELLHVAQELAGALRARGITHVGLLATTGTHASGLYESALAAHGVRCAVPNVVERQRVMHGIYHGVKAGHLDEAGGHFADVAQAVVRRHGCQAVIMGCTEIPLALPPAAVDVPLIDPAQVLAAALAARAYAPAP